MHRNFRKPLIVMTPKSLLRHKLAVVERGGLPGRQPLQAASCPTPTAPPDADTKRLVLCTGKVAYDLIEARDAAGDTDTQIVRVEQLYPFPGEPLAERVAADAEPRRGRLGAGGAEEQRLLVLRRAADRGGAGDGELPVARARYAGRAASASPATGPDEAPPARTGARWSPTRWATMSARKSAARDEDRRDTRHCGPAKARKPERLQLDPAFAGTKEEEMATEVTVPVAGRIDHRSDARRMAQAARRRGRRRRADRQPGDRQGLGRGAVARSRA